ncbi:MAG: hypothetical protein ACRCUY_11485 [Thermoguttaceae bacterium]
MFSVENTQNGDYNEESDIDVIMLADMDKDDMRTIIKAFFAVYCLRYSFI